MRKPDGVASFPVIGLCGLASSGKDYLAKGLVNQGYTRLAFADEVRAMLVRLNPIVSARHRADFRRPDGRLPVRVKDVVKGEWDALKEELPALYNQEIRPLLQRLGTECIRDIDPTFWVKAVDGLLQDLATDPNGQPEGIVVTDVRFANEAEWIHELGGYVIKIARPGVKQLDHSSEVIDFEYDAMFCNEGDGEQCRETFVDVVDALLGKGVAS